MLMFSFVVLALSAYFKNGKMGPGTPVGPFILL
jgi:hypothetical protein